MDLGRTLSLVAATAALAAAAPAARAQTCVGVAIYDNCIASIGRAGGPMAVVNGIFRTADGRDARALTFGRYLRGVNGCVGETTDPTRYTAYECHTPASAMETETRANALDFQWVQSLRTYDDGTGVPDGVGPGRPAPGHDCDRGDNCGYVPWRGKVFDLRGESNRVAVFPITDHTDDSCLEAFEYSVYLTNNHESTALVPDGAPPDPTRWNRAVLIRAFTEGWTRGGADPETPSPRGNYVADSPTLVWALPCGITFRYVSLVPGNYGSPGLECRFNSSDDELDAVAGLNEDNTAVCPDADGDGHRAATCGGDDCNDMDPRVHPGVAETCATPVDRNCDDAVPQCPAGTTCFQGLCAAPCGELGCAAGFTCVTSDGGAGGCVPSACAMVTCPEGQVCGPMGCQDPCAGAVCPAGQVCRGGACIDPCAGVRCPMRQHCDAGRCVPDCPCVACASGTTCNEPAGRCEAPGCATLRCPAGTTRDCAGALPRCVTPCEGVTCPLGTRCAPDANRCVPDRCFGVACPAGLTCAEGECVRPPRPDAGGIDVPSLDAAVPDAAGTTDARPADARADARPRVDATLPDDDPAGCACRAVPAARAPGAGWLAALAALALTARRRRPARRPGG